MHGTDSTISQIRCITRNLQTESFLSFPSFLMSHYGSTEIQKKEKLLSAWHNQLEEHQILTDSIIMLEMIQISRRQLSKSKTTVFFTAALYLDENVLNVSQMYGTNYVFLLQLNIRVNYFRLVYIFNYYQHTCERIYCSFYERN